MNILEMHIEIDLGVQKMNSSAYRDISPEEKDRVLNKMQQYFVDGAYDPSADSKMIGFEGNGRRTSDISDLIVKNRLLSVYSEEKESNCSIAILPLDFLYFIPSAIRGHLKVPCSKDANPEVKAAVFTQYQLELPKSEDYAGMKLKYLYEGKDGLAVDEVLFDMDTYYADGLPDADLMYELRHVIVETINSKTPYEAAWISNENGQTVTLISGKPHKQGEKLYLTLGDGTINSTEKTLTYKQNTYEKGTYKDYTYKLRLVGHDDLFDLMQNSLGRTKYNSPLCVVADKKLYIYDDGKFHVERLLLDYVRKPRLMNYALGWDCEIRSESAQHRIVDMAIKHIIRAIESGSYQPVAVENQLSQ